jgi:hypothetical protein
MEKTWSTEEQERLDAIEADLIEQGVPEGTQSRLMAERELEQHETAQANRPIIPRLTAHPTAGSILSLLFAACPKVLNESYDPAGACQAQG